MTLEAPPPGAGSRDARERTRVWLVEDNELYRRSLADLLGVADDLDCALAVGSCEEALAGLDAGEIPDIVFMDIGLPGMNGIEGTRRIRSLSPTSRVVMLTVHEEDDKVFEAICAGASGYLLKSAPADRIVEAVRQVVRGDAPINGQIASKMLRLFAGLAPREPATAGYGLSPREREILQHLVDGMTMKQIARRLGVSYHTVTTHVRNIYEKLHVHSRSGAVSKAIREGLV
jgi:DNA-binding NarL/FixJ family response regulator